jgi:hypothetical protein
VIAAIYARKTGAAPLLCAFLAHRMSARTDLQISDWRKNLRGVSRRAWRGDRRQQKRRRQREMELIFQRIESSKWLPGGKIQLRILVREGTLRAALGFLELPPRAPELRLIRRCGPIAVAMPYAGESSSRFW